MRAMTSPAISTVQSVPCWELSNCSPTGTVNLLVLLIMISGQRKEFHTPMKPKAATTASAGLDRGRMIRRKTARYRRRLPPDHPAPVQAGARGGRSLGLHGGMELLPLAADHDQQHQ